MVFLDAFNLFCCRECVAFMGLFNMISVRGGTSKLRVCSMEFVGYSTRVSKVEKVFEEEARAASTS
jgi:hypothetical protein